MVRTAVLIVAAIGIIGIAAAQAEPVPPRATDFSSQQNKKKVVPAARSGAGQPRTFNRNTSTNRNTNNTNRNNNNTNRNTNTNRNANFNANRRINNGGAQQQQQQFRRVGGPGRPQGFVGSGGAGARSRFIAGPGRVMPYRAGNHPMIRLGARSAPIFRGPRRLYWGGRWRTFVPLAALGAVAIGGVYYYADGYLSLPRNSCQGSTPDGCRLNWQRVDFEEGDGDWQCVQYCGRPGAPPPARTVALVSPPPVTQGSCEVAIFSEPGFRGTNATSTDEQPHLSELGWRDQIASIKVVSGTWDFFNDEDFTGDVVRFGPGEYPDLGAEWSRKAGSFMCVQP